MNMNQKGFTNIVLVVAIIVILIGAVGYFALMNKPKPITQQPTPTQTKTHVSPTPTQEPTTTSNVPTTWKTWRSDVYGFSIRYPGKEDIHIKVTDRLGGIDPGGLEYFLGVEENGIHIFPAKYESEFNLDSWLSKHISLKAENIYNKQTLSINSRSAFQFDTKDDVGVKYEPYEGGSVDSFIDKDMRFVVIQGTDRFIVSWFPLANKYGANFFTTYSKMISSLMFVR